MQAESGCAKMAASSFIVWFCSPILFSGLSGGGVDHHDCIFDSAYYFS
jgi:hypothetical protein